MFSFGAAGALIVVVAFLAGFPAVAGAYSMDEDAFGLHTGPSAPVHGAAPAASADGDTFSAHAAPAAPSPSAVPAAPMDSDPFAARGASPAHGAAPSGTPAADPGHPGAAANGLAIPAAPATSMAAVLAPYKVQPGDLLTISVWKEQDLQSDVYVRPDGGLSFPLAGDIQASGHTVEEVRQMIEKRLRRVISDPEVTVLVKQIGGNRIYVVGKVNKPGDFALNGPLDVMQAISLAGGATPFAELNDIRVIRRENNAESAIRFRYHDVEAGRHLDQNILLHNGDTVVVP